MTAETLETKGRRTREAILARGVDLACRVGLGGLTIGTLAADVGMSKSGMYAHFGSKEALQLAVLDAAAQDFTAAVVAPALAQPRGEARIRALVDRWLACGIARQPGGCLFVKASTEVDEQEGPVRDALRAHHAGLYRTLARIVTDGVAEGRLRSDADPDQFASDVYGVMLAFYHAHRLLGDPAAEARARAAVEALIDAARVPAALPATAPPATAPPATSLTGRSDRPTHEHPAPRSVARPTAPTHETQETP